MNTPRTSNSSLNGDSPDRLFRRFEVQDVMEDDAATHTKAGEEEGERLWRMSTKPSALEGSDQKQVHFVIRFDKLATQYRDVYGCWLEEIGESVSLVNGVLNNSVTSQHKPTRQ